MKQFIFAIHPSVAIADAPTDQTWRILLGLQDALAGNVNTNKITARVAGTFSNLHLRCHTPVGAGVTVIWSLEKNGVDTALAVTLAGASVTDYQNTTDSVHVDVGDNIQWHPRLTSSSSSLLGTRISLCVEFDSDVPNECFYAKGTVIHNNDNFSPIFHHQGRISYLTAQEAKDVMGVPGNITQLYAATLIAAGAGGTDLAPGLGNWFEVALVKNGVTQDGSGGTVDTRCRIADANVNQLATFVLPVVAGDLICLHETNSGGLNAFLSWRATIKFVSTEEDTFSICLSNNPPISTVNPSYWAPQTEGNWVTSITESQQVMVGPITPLTLGGMIGDIETGAGDPTEGIHYYLRKNGADAGLQLDFIGSQTTDLASGSPVVLTSTDLWTIRKIGTGATPGSGNDQAISFPGLIATESPSEPEPEPALGVIGPLVWVEWPRRVTT